MADYLHGVETINKGNAPKNVSEVKTSVIGIVGRAASSGWTEEPAVNTPIVIMKKEDVENKLGTSDEEGTLPYYLKKMYEQFDKQIPLIIAVNVGTDSGSSEPEDTNIYLVDHEGNIITDSCKRKAVMSGLCKVKMSGYGKISRFFCFGRRHAKHGV